uniref:Uncharacterized protein n=1 Tax=Arundo donax TaxID=35708 RepID=A0A0A9FMB3_ARUDO
MKSKCTIGFVLKLSSCFRSLI